MSDHDDERRGVEMIAGLVVIVAILSLVGIIGVMLWN